MGTVFLVALIVWGAVSILAFIAWVIGPPINPGQPSVNGDTTTLLLQPGREAFTPNLLPQGEKYKITLSGIYQYKPSWMWHQADGCYKAEDYNFSDRYRKLRFDGELVKDEPFEEDRFLHRYSFAYAGTGRRLAILLYPPKSNYAATAGYVEVSITVLSAADKLVLDEVQRQCRKRDKQDRLEAERQQQAELLTERQHEVEKRQQRKEQQARERREAAKAREEEGKRARQRSLQSRRAARERKREEEEADRIETQEQLKRLRIRSHLERNVLDPQYRENVATYHSEKVIASKSLIVDGYAEFMANDELVTAARQQAPEVLDFMEALLDLVQLAERKEAEPKPALPVPEPPARTRLNEEQIRALKAHRKTRQARDAAAEQQALLDSALEFRQSLERYPIDEDEKMREYQDYCDRISSEEAGSGKKLD
jgi:hypothetical protein